MKTTLKRIIGFVEYLFGVAVIILLLVNIISGEFFNKLKLEDIVRIPWGILLYYSMIKYGWYWMFNIVDITDIKLLKADDPYFITARAKAHSDIETFLGYLRQGEMECGVLVPKDIKKIKSKRKWQKAEYLNNKEISLVVNNENKKTINLDIVDDWIVNKEDFIIGYYTFKALSEKATRNGEKLSKKSKRILQRIVT